MPQSIDIIYLSPHLDDAALSCGGAMHRQAAQGQRVVVLTVCAGQPPPGPLSPFAEGLHVRWGAAPAAAAGAAAQMVALRRAEDAAALERLGVAGRYLDVPDCIYRQEPDTERWLYASEAAIFAHLDRSDDWQAAAIAEQLQALPGLTTATQLRAPLAVGHHVDHQLARRAAEIWAQPGAALAYYEDFPYAEREGRLQEVLQPLDAWQPTLVYLDEADVVAKIEAIEHYASQISTFWPDPIAMAQAVRDYAWRRGSFDALAERLWRRA